MYMNCEIEFEQQFRHRNVEKRTKLDGGFLCSQ